MEPSPSGEGRLGEGRLGGRRCGGHAWRRPKGPFRELDEVTSK